MFQKRTFASATLLGVLVAVICFSGCTKAPVTPDGGLPPTQGTIAWAGESGVASDLSNITNKDMFQLSDEAKALLVENGFVVVSHQGPSYYHREFFTLYEQNRYCPVPQLVTTDSLLHTYHLFYDFLLRTVETDALSAKLETMGRAMLDASARQYTELLGTPWESAAKRNLAFFAVGARLLDPAATVPPEVASLVLQELGLIDKHEGIAVSPIMGLGQDADVTEALKEDYSQYIPRGHYDKSEPLQAYFKAMMWYGRLTFRFSSEDETRSAVLMTLALDQGTNSDLWTSIYEPTSFFVGVSDDVTYLELKDALVRTYGSGVDLQSVIADADKWLLFTEGVKELRAPSINSIPIFDETINPDREKETKGFRFMGQRFSLDASIFQRLAYRDVKENPEGERRMLPKALDIPAALGSEEAYSILESMGETAYEMYPENMAELQRYIGDLDPEGWSQNLYWSWLRALLPLTESKADDAYPAFMRSQAWARKELNTFLGSWCELKHDTILYVKQFYAETGGGDVGVDDRGYVEANPEVFFRLAALAKTTREGFLARGLINERDKESLDRLETLCLSLGTIAEKELTGGAITTEDYDLIRSYGAQLEHFWIEALRDAEFPPHRSQADNQPAALIADVATDPTGFVLEEAIGYIDEIYAAVPVDGELRIVKGGVYSYYEFVWPMEDRLTDAKWREMLDEGNAPPRSEWAQAFLAR